MVKKEFNIKSLNFPLIADNDLLTWKLFLINKRRLIHSAGIKKSFLGLIFKQEKSLMECKFHPGEETVEKCVLCYTPVCLKCLSKCREFSYDCLCPKCLKSVGLSANCLIDDLDCD